MYENALESTRDLIADYREGRLRPIDFRDDEIAKVLEYLDAERSVLLTGPLGVGKTAVMHGLAAVLAERGRGGLRQVSCNEILAGTRYLGEWQSKVTELATQAAGNDTTVLITDVWNLRTVGKTSQDPSGIIDAIAPLVEGKALRLVGEVHAEKLREMQREPRLLSMFQQVAIHPLTAEQVDEILSHEAERESVRLEPETRKALVSLSSRFLPARGQPGPAIELFSRVRDYQSEKEAAGEKERLSKSFVEKVFSIYSGLPLFIVSRTETASASEIRAAFSERIVGQREAVEAMVETIALFKAGLQDPDRPLGTFFFVGPTGVGKTEIARALAEFLFGSAHRLLRFDLSEFKDYHSFEMLLGDPEKPMRPARLLDPVRAQPFQVVLFDEIEKAHSNVWDMLLPLLDDGQLTRPSGETVSFRNTIVIVTSNVGAQHSDRSLGFGATSNRSAAITKALEGAFRPEFLNRFQHLVVFHPLSLEQVKMIAKMELAKILSREGISDRNVIVDVAEDALDLVISRGFDPKYGARALKRELQRQVVLPVAMTLLERAIEPGTLLRVVVKKGELRVRVIETAESREARRESEPVLVSDASGPKRLSREEILSRALEYAERIEVLATDADQPFLEAEQARIVEIRRHPEFWNNPEDAALALRDLDRVGWMLHRLDRLRSRAEDLRAGIEAATMRRDIVDFGARLTQLEDDIATAGRELVKMGKDGGWDALLEVRPIGAGGRVARDLLVKTYSEWAEHRGMTVDWLCEPLADDESAMLSISGRCAAGYLLGETGLHRTRDGETSSVAAVRVAPWTDKRADAQLLEHRALKKTGQFGGRVRSRLVTGSGLILQNDKRLAENRDFAGELEPSWADAADVGEEVTRRIELTPFRLRDTVTGESSGRADLLRGRNFHRLLCRRLDALATRTD